MASATVEAAIDRAAPAELLPCTLTELLLYFLRLGTTGFGGPIALVGYMQRDLVEKRRWISRQDYVEGLALAQLAPGPLAAQLAIYLGWVRGGVSGATLVGVAFVLPSFLMVLALSALYLRYGGLAWMQGAFYGIGAAVIAIIARSAYKLVRMTLARDRLLWMLFVVSALVTASTESELVWVFLLCGVAALGVFLPCYLFVVIPAAYFRRSVNDPRVKAFVDGVTAAATGAIAGAAFVLGRRSLIDIPTVAIGLATLLILTYVRKVPEPLVILAAGLIGLLLKGVVGQ